MTPNRVYSYDHESCTFVEVAPSRKGLWLKAGAVFALALVLSAVGVGIVSQTVTSPAEVAQRQEIDALRGHLEQANVRLASFSQELSHLAETDREIYRTVLNADPISEDEFQMGVGGDEGDAYGRYAAPTAALLRRTSATFDRLERQLELQERSYEELRGIAGRREAVLRQQPAVLPIRDARLTSGFGMRFHPVLRVSRLHAGVDFPTPVGTPLYATGDGTVSFAGQRSGYGNVLEVDHPLAGKMTRFAHLSRVAPGIGPGTAVRRGQVIAYSGNTGLSTGPHLHYEVRLLDAGRTPVNPVTTFVPGVTPAEYRELVAAARAPTMSFD